MTQEKFNIIIGLNKEKEELEETLRIVEKSSDLALCAYNSYTHSYAPICKGKSNHIVALHCQKAIEEMRIRLMDIEDRIKRL